MFVVVVAIDLLGRGESEVGVLQGAVGIGALVGSAACTLLVGSRAMTRWLAVAVVLWGVPLAVIGVVPEYAVALAAAAVVGVGNAMVDVTAFTLVARMVPDAVLARVFGLLESLGALGGRTGLAGRPLARGDDRGPRGAGRRRPAGAGGLRALLVARHAASTARSRCGPTPSTCSAGCRCCARCR